MKMIKAIVRPEKADIVVRALDEAGFISMTKLDVFGRGKQKGLTVGGIHYDELPKVMFLLVVDDESLDAAVDTIIDAAKTGNFGDGKIFITPVIKAYTISTGKEEL